MSSFRLFSIASVSLSLLSGALPGQSVARVAISGHAEQGSTSVAGLDARIAVDLDGTPFSYALEAIARQASLPIVLTDPVARLNRRITLKTPGMRARDAFQTVLLGTPVRMTVSPQGHLLFDVVAVKNKKTQGTLSGKVTDAATGRPIANATVQIEGTTRVTQTAEDGSFRMTDVPPGTQVVVVRRLGYQKVTRSTTIGEGSVATVDVALETSANALEQVVVTGTIVQTELKAVPSAITVVTAKQIEERGITKIDQLFRGEIPGLFAQNQGSYALLDEVTMYSRGATALSGASAGVSITGNTNPIKTYVDGIELANPGFLSQIDPKSIDRIEILTGPQASTIYGSNAMNGVMQVFTKRGMTSKPQLTLSLLSGWVENNFSTARTPQHDYTAQLNGIEGRLSYNAGGSWMYVGPWTPAKQTTRTGAFGGARLEMPTPVGAMTADLTLRRSIMRNRRNGDDQQTQTAYRESGWWTNISTAGLFPPTNYALVDQTLGLTFGYTPTAWWTHELSVGQDASDNELRYTGRGFRTISDTTLYMQQAHDERRSIRYTSTVRAPVGSLASVTLTVGADAWQALTSQWSVSPQTLTGTLTGSTLVSRQPTHNTGGFLQTQVGVKDHLFLTYGLRAEWNPTFGEEVLPNYAPRYGIAYSRDLGAVTTKVRGSYGRSTRPPRPQYKSVQRATDVFASSWATTFAPYYAPFDFSIANPELLPEHQQGGEGGVELYFGTRASLIVTRYNQTVDGIIDSPIIDSVRTFIPCPSSCGGRNDPATGYNYFYQRQYVNLGSIRNQGWELQGSTTVGPLTTRGTYSWTKSRTIGVNPRYASSFVFSPQYQRGAAFQGLPEHTWAFGITYAQGRTTLGLNLSGTGQVLNVRNDFSIRYLGSGVRLPQNRLNFTNGTNTYANFNEAYALADITAAHRFTSHMEGLLQVQNLTDSYTNDYYSAYATMGRQVKAGFRLRTR